MIPHPRALLLALALIIAARLVLIRTSDPPQRRPNLLLVTVDTLRADELGVYGSPLDASPALDRLARRSTVYQMAVAPSPWTLPSIASIMTGLEPKTHGAILFRRAMPERVRTLAEKLRVAGYHTSAAVTHFVLGPEYGFDRGFERFEPKLIPQTDQQAHLSVTSEALTDVGVELLRETEGPFFVWLHYFDPHFHYLPHPPLTRAGMEPGPAGRNYYRGEVRATDRALGRLFAAAAELRNPPVVLFTADHGEQFLDHGGQQHTTAVYQEVIAVPLLVAAPGAEQGRIVPAPTRLVDLHRVVLDLAGVRAPAENSPHEPPVLVHTEQAADLRAIVAGRYKLIADLRRARLELYDLAADPAERRNLGAAQPELLARMCNALAGHFEGLAREGERLRPPDEQLELSDERAEQLESLGYVGAAGAAASDAPDALRALCEAAAPAPGPAPGGPDAAAGAPSVPGEGAPASASPAPAAGSASAPAAGAVTEPGAPPPE